MEKLQLFCIPFAGGSAAAFNELERYINRDIDVVKIEYPGRGIRKEEPYLETIGNLIDDVAASIEMKRNKELPYALFGYSLGSAIAYELVQRRMLAEFPYHMFISAREALDEYSASKSYSNLSTDEFLEKIKQLGGMDKRILQDKRFLSIYMKPIYADYKLWGQYHYKPCGKMPCIDITVFYSEKDTPYKKISGWKSLTKGTVEFYEFGDNHFFIKEHAQEMARIINGVLSSFHNI